MLIFNANYNRYLIDLFSLCLLLDLADTLFHSLWYQNTFIYVSFPLMPDTLWLDIVVFVPHYRGGSESCITALLAPTSVFPQMFITVMKEYCNFLLNQTFYKKGYFLLLVKVVCHVIVKIKGILHSFMVPLFTCQHWKSKGSYLKKGK